MVSILVVESAPSAAQSSQTVSSAVVLQHALSAQEDTPFLQQDRASQGPTAPSGIVMLVRPTVPLSAPPAPQDLLSTPTLLAMWPARADSF